MTFIEEKTPYSDFFPNTVKRVCERVGTQYSCAAAAVVRGDGGAGVRGYEGAEVRGNGLDDLTLDDITATPREKTREEIIAEAEASAFAEANEN